MIYVPSILSSVHIRFGDHTFNVLAVDSGDLVTLEKAVHIVF